MPSAGQASRVGPRKYRLVFTSVRPRLPLLAEVALRPPSVAVTGSSTTGVVGRLTQLDFGNLNWSGVTSPAVRSAVAGPPEESEGCTRSLRPGAYLPSYPPHRKHQLVVGEASLVSYDLRGEMNTASARRTERVRHLVRSVGVELD